MRQRMRRSFSQQNLATEGEGPLAPVLTDALIVPRESGYRLTHAFHPYPGRFHPRLAERVLAEVARPGERVLDPFMGGGTVLVEGLSQGLAATGVDLNPVALLVARERTRPRTPDAARALVADAERIAGLVEGLRREKRPPRVKRRHLSRIAPWYAPHLLAELLQLVRIVDALPAGAERETLRAVFSALAVKFSIRESDSRGEAAPSAYPKGAASRFFVAKCRELAEAQVALGDRFPRPWPRPELLREDARLLPSLGWGCVDLILTSPPYPGVYDYHDQHRLRMDWLELDGEPFHGGEIGARRDGVPDGWSAAMRDVLVALARAIRPGGNLFVVIGDWVEGAREGGKSGKSRGGARPNKPHGVDGAGMTLRIAAGKGWRCLSRASVQRECHNKWEQVAFAKRGKWEHLLHFRHGGGRPDAPPPGK